MARFSYITTKRHTGTLASLLPTLLLFTMVIVLFVVGTGSLSKGSTKRQKESLTDALSRDIVYCYATTGHYPESLEAIRSDYGLYYNEDLFYVDYQVRAQNIIPDVTIIELHPEDTRTPAQKAIGFAQETVYAVLEKKEEMKNNILERAENRTILR
ncbi:MAG: hypothetical protein IJ682_09270 [Lachnospiraceae bacterium]|nr:hypothetical protein [Lachnospiraceae bacterium]